jgi:hypothetical protein
LLFVLVLQVLFAITYPLNAGASDNPVYLEMIRTGTSNLILASGYPFVIHSLLGIMQIPAPTDVYNPAWLGQIQVLQNAIHAAFLVGFAVSALRVFGEATAACAIVLLGASTLFLGGLNSAAPEWLQGDCIALALVVAAKAFSSRDGPSKAALFAAAFAVATLAYLVKPNSLVVIPFIALFVIFDERKRLRKLRDIGLGATVAAVTVVIYAEFFHLPSTGTRQLNYDHAWVLMYALPDDYLESPPQELGADALRWRALSALAPSDYWRAYAYQTIDTGAPIEIKHMYLARYREIMQMPREDLVGFVIEHPLPPGFQQDLSAIPLYWYFGLQEADDLGIAVYTESLSARWPYYAGKVATGLGDWGAYQADVVPFDSQTLGLIMHVPQDDNGSVRYSVPVGRVPQFMRYWNPTESVWAPGTVMTQYLSWLLLPRFGEVCLALAALAGVLRHRASNTRTSMRFVFAVVGALVVGSYMLVGLRDKEQISLLPTLSLFYAFGVVWVSGILARWLKVRAPA